MPPTGVPPPPGISTPCARRPCYPPNQANVPRVTRPDVRLSCKYPRRYVDSQQLKHVTDRSSPPRPVARSRARTSSSKSKSHHTPDLARAPKINRPRSRRTRPTTMYMRAVACNYGTGGQRSDLPGNLTLLSPTNARMKRRQGNQYPIGFVRTMPSAFVTRGTSHSMRDWGAGRGDPA